VYAIVQTGGKQYKVSPGDIVRVEKLEVAEGQATEIHEVLAVTKDTGELVAGTPFIAGAKVVARVLSHGKADKILVFKYKSKANYRRRYGHRQPYTRLQVESIEL
jgi:large subunit ribosomal protein L21